MRRIPLCLLALMVVACSTVTYQTTGTPKVWKLYQCEYQKAKGSFSLVEITFDAEKERLKENNRLGAWSPKKNPTSGPYYIIYHTNKQVCTLDKPQVYNSGFFDSKFTPKYQPPLKNDLEPRMEKIFDASLKARVNYYLKQNPLTPLGQNENQITLDITMTNGIVRGGFTINSKEEALEHERKKVFEERLIEVPLLITIRNTQTRQLLFQSYYMVNPTFNEEMRNSILDSFLDTVFQDLKDIGLLSK